MVLEVMIADLWALLCLLIFARSQLLLQLLSEEASLRWRLQVSGDEVCQSY